ncbi:protein THEMIS isoform X2 [Pristis pectinata]|uniref:protein THEMIS isoform X2 n=1 Tax=Pristis pectinata TaxID=685728 RepID=UPI00223E4C82|nr:protein THEMIS isoform X2 [Pristis pectinata]
MAEVYQSDSEIITLQDYICSLNFSTLPRILEIHSGVYFQGSVYEISGNECCLSTGEFIKIIHIELQKVVCENMDNKSKFDLPLNYSGHFKLIPEEFPFTSIEEIIKSTEIRKQSSEVITFQSMTDIVTDHAVIQKGELITVISTVVYEGQMYADCVVDGHCEQFHVRLPFMLKGQFNECESDNSYTVQDIIESQTLTRRRVRLAETEGICVPKHFNGALIISPVYEIQAIMNLRKEVVKIPSTLEVDVRDVTEEQKDAIFIKPLSLTDISNQPHETFPIIVEILDAPDQQAPFKSEWFHLLRKGRNIIIYKKVVLKKVLATSVHNKISRHFLISEHYKGTFRRRPREFPTAFDLCNAFTPEDPLHFVVTNDCTWNEGGSSLCIGDRLVTMFKTTSQVAIEGVLQSLDVVVCRKLPEDEEEEEEDVAQPLMLPLYLEGRFVEEIRDTKKYKISEIYEKFKLPFQVKVTSKDPSLPTDSLTSFPTIKLEEIIEVPTLIASYLDNPSECFSIPIEWVTMTVQVLEDCYGEDCCYESVATVEELTNFMYYNLLRCSTPSQCPPPRPPKQPSKGTLSRSPAPIQNPSHSPVPDNKQLKPPLLPERASICPKSTIVAETKALPPTSGKLFSKQHTEATPNEYAKSQKRKKKKTPKLPEEKLTCDDDHDYEQVKEVAPKALYDRRAWSPSTKMTEESNVDSDHDYEQVEGVTLMALQAMRMWTP